MKPLSIANTTKNGEDKMLAEFRALKPLIKTHYSWPMPDEYLNLIVPDAMNIMCEFARVTGAICLRAEYATERNVICLAEVCSKTKAKLTLLYTPFYKGGGVVTPIENAQKELEVIRARLTSIKQYLDKYNNDHALNIQFEMILLDFEAWQRQEKAISILNNVYGLFKFYWPQTRIHWYSMGGIIRDASNLGYGLHGFINLEIKKTEFSIPLYNIPDLGTTREIYNRTCQLADSFYINQVIPWIALGSGFKPANGEEFPPFIKEWDYDIGVSKWLGFEINNPWFSKQYPRYPKWDRATFAVFYPTMAGAIWFKHFCAYCEGASK